MGPSRLRMFCDGACIRSPPPLWGRDREGAFTCNEITEPVSHPEQFLVAGLDRIGIALDAGRIVLELLDLAERLAAGLLLGLRMDRAQATDVDDELLAFRREAVALEQLSGVR